MKVILIHGPPGVGKFTVAKELSKITNYKLIHIHTIYDLLENIFTKEQYETSLKILNHFYLDIFKEAAKANIKGIIITYADITKDNFAFVKQVKKIIQQHHGQLQFVLLRCTKKELKKRVVNISRKTFKKTKTIKELEFLLTIKDYKSILPKSKTLKIDNTNLSAKIVAQKIKKYYSL